MTPPPPAAGASCSTNGPFSRCSCRRGPRGGLRVVGDHDDRLAELVVQPAQQRQHLLRALRVELARRLVEKDQRRVGHDRARDGDPLLLAARELARVMLAAGRPARRHPARCAPVRRARFFESRVRRSGSSTFWKAVRTGSRLNDWNTKPTFASATPRAAPRVIALTSAPPTRTVPLVGLSSPAMRLSRVDLPEPDGPMRAVKVPCSMSIESPLKTSIRSASRLKALVRRLEFRPVPWSCSSVFRLLADRYR